MLNCEGINGEYYTFKYTQLSKENSDRYYYKKLRARKPESIKDLEESLMYYCIKTFDLGEYFNYI